MDARIGEIYLSRAELGARVRELGAEIARDYAGREPVLSHVPYSNDQMHETLDRFNAVIDDLTRTNQLQVGPDFTTYFKAHTDQLMDNVHPDPDGRKAMNQLWADAMRVVYP